MQTIDSLLHIICKTLGFAFLFLVMDLCLKGVKTTRLAFVWWNRPLTDFRWKLGPILPILKIWDLKGQSTFLVLFITKVLYFLIPDKAISDYMPQRRGGFGSFLINAGKWHDVCLLLWHYFSGLCGYALQFWIKIAAEIQKLYHYMHHK